MHLSPESIDIISRQAIVEYPSECCGIVTGAGDLQRVHTLKNIQERLHAEDADTHPRDSRTAYAADRNEVGRVIAEAAQRDETVLAFYHSHTDADAYFSRMDKEAQTVFGEPEFPGAVHVVVSVREGVVHEIKGYFWDNAQQDFVSVAVR
jgi:proteasome lid subunit RPN8/RPN11